MRWVPSSHAFRAPLVAAVTRRPLRYMGKDAMWKYGWSAWFFTSLGGFPVHRGTADREALKKCVAVLEGGEPLVLFPEGTRQTGPVVDEVFDGAAYVALRTGAPIVPVGIGGSEKAMPKGAKFLRPVRVTMVVGEPLHPSPTDDPAAVTAQLRARMAALLEQAQRDYPVAAPSGAWWQPAHLGGGAPTEATAAVLDADDPVVLADRTRTTPPSGKASP